MDNYGVEWCATHVNTHRLVDKWDDCTTCENTVGNIILSVELPTAISILPINHYNVH